LTQAISFPVSLLKRVSYRTQDLKMAATPPVAIISDSKAASACRGIFKEKGLEVNADNFLELEVADRKRIYGALDYFAKKNPSHEISMQHAEVTDDKMRRACVARYLIATGAGKTSVVQSTSVTNKTAMNGVWRWLHRSQIVKILKCELLADDAIAECEPRPSEYKKAAARGEKQYYFWETFKTTSLEGKSATTATNEADVDGETYDGIKDDMENLIKSSGSTGMLKIADAEPGVDEAVEPEKKTRKKSGKQTDDKKKKRGKLGRRMSRC
jgi:hypothetical protein